MERMLGSPHQLFALEPDLRNASHASALPKWVSNSLLCKIMWNIMNEMWNKLFNEVQHSQLVNYTSKLFSIHFSRQLRENFQWIIKCNPINYSSYFWTGKKKITEKRSIIRKYVVMYTSGVKVEERALDFEHWFYDDLIFVMKNNVFLIISKPFPSVHYGQMQYTSWIILGNASCRNITFLKNVIFSFQRNDLIWRKCRKKQLLWKKIL